MPIPHHHRALVVDDQADFREGVVAVLEASGFRAAGASNGKEALALLRAEPDGYCVLLLDLCMPEMSGLDVRREQRADPSIAHIPVVVLSADQSQVADAARLGVRESLRKPIEPDAIVATAARHCYRAGWT